MSLFTIGKYRVWHLCTWKCLGIFCILPSFWIAYNKPSGNPIVSILSFDFKFCTFWFALYIEKFHGYEKDIKTPSLTSHP